MHDIGANIEALKAQIKHTATKRAFAGCVPAIVAVSKKQPADAIRAAYAAGVCDFGENYVQEALEKQRQLDDLPLVWHFIGPIQSNKTRLIAEHFDWVHSVDRLKIAQRLSYQRQPGARVAPANRALEQTENPLTETHNDASIASRAEALNICLQVNIDDDEAKAGVSTNQLMQLAGQVADLPNLRLRGLMIMPRQSSEQDKTRDSFRRGHELFEQARDFLGTRVTGFDTLSMGMSGDFELAIEEGASLLRLGTAIFGARIG
ncbi:MAG: YggS family pyridoxal phosphate-dependent enzyme [Gammaproteobacteria bacterium]|nr:YggS family pyridoxal phosphate-dependent enzyme [Gammaproteobacteria bacterium]MBT8150012.1 YggS family pyridoxal phosphate-dependent enzyme [Gammaproteobacteria bacterium]NND40132.1 YggS family pyridoxal phosphate-dependent enzyme [Pseudomonadales bacterium]RZV58567.1 MAG: YggS family pyridoxal phosphate-dependent enzyme [Pseudomonadales bacterium]